MIAGEITDLAAFKDHVKNNPESEATEMVQSAPPRRKGLRSWGEDDNTSMDDENEVDGGEGEDGDGDGDGGINNDNNGNGDCANCSEDGNCGEENANNNELQVA
jgi:hypothetical protein